MRQEQSLPRAVGRSFSPLSIARDTANQRSRAREPLAARGELRKVDDALRAARPRGASLEEAASRQALAQLAMASHDLRDPLQVIASHVELVADGFRGAISVEQRACLDDVRAQIDHLSAVVGSVLALARATQQGRALELSDVPVSELLAHVRDLVAPLAIAAGVSLVVDCKDGPAMVRGERTALARVLVNLASNGIKATHRGGRIVLTAATAAEAVELRVGDTGSGIPSAQLRTIFEPFVQLHSGETARAGLGLGLTIARDLTRLMGGELLVHSVVGVGSVFTVRLPRSPRLTDEGASALVAHAA